MMKLFNFILLIYFIKLTKSSEYVINPTNDYVVDKCPGHENNFLDKYFDWSKLEITRIDEETLVATGPVNFLKDLPKNATIELELKIFQKVLSNWNEYIGLYRDNMCLTLFSSSEMWYPMTKVLEEKYRICPPNPKSTLNLKNIKLQLRFSTELSGAKAGDYKAMIILRYDGDYICSVVYGALTTE